MTNQKMHILKVLIWYLVFGILIVSGCGRQARQNDQPVEAKQGPTTLDENEDSSGEMLSAFSVSGYTKGGKKEWDLAGKSADIMPEEIKLNDVTGKVYGKEINMTIVADQGNLNRLDNNVHLEKNVKAITDDGATLIADYLDWDAQNERLSSEAPVWIQRGAMEAFGTGIVGQPTLNFVKLKKDVTVKIFMEEKPPPSEQDPAKLSQDKATPPTVITCDGPLDVDYQKNLAIFQDNIKVEDKRGEIFADQMDIHFAAQQEGEKKIQGMEGMGIDKIVAVGNVEIYRGENISYSQKAVYDTQTGVLTLTGRPKLVIYSTEGLGQLMSTPDSEQQDQAQAEEKQD